MDKKNTKKYILNVAIILLVGGLSIYFSIGNQLEGTIESLSHCHLGWLLVVVILMLIFYLINAMNLTLFARVYKENYSLKQGIVNAMAGIFFNGITPMASGGQFYQIYAFNKQGIKATYSSSILLMIFIVYQSVLVLYTSIIMLLKFAYFSSLYSGFFSLAIVGFVINLVVISTLFLGAKSERLQNFLSNNVVKLLAKLHIVKDYEETSSKIERKLENFRVELNLLQKNKPILLKSIGLNVLKLTVLYSIPFFCSLAMNVPLSWKHFFDLIGITAFVYLISDFVPLPGASGGSEGSFFILLRYFLKNATSATLLVWRFATYYAGLIIGGLTMSFSKELNISTLKESHQPIEENGIVIEDIEEVELKDFKK